MTNNTDVQRGTILFDADCGLCRTGAASCGGILRRHRFDLLPLQSDRARTLSGATNQDLLTEVHLVTPAGEVLRGVDALLFIASAIPWARPLAAIRYVPGGLPLARLLYRFIARHRYQAEYAVRWLVPISLLAAASLLAASLPPWGCMWVLALALFAASKWITWWPYRRVGSTGRSFAYFFAWTGMDARRFLDRFGNAAPPARRDWVAAVIKLATGISLVALAHAHAKHETSAAWMGMIGLVLALHFGLFALLALAWQARGIDAKPLMNRPLRSTSLGELWGRRWNSGFNALAEQTIFTPLARRYGPARATAAVFLVSGLIHDLLISVPARGGYSLPTLYFLIQLAGLLVERTRPARRLGLGRGAIGWLYTACVALIPMPLLFHEPFVRNVMIPMFHAIGVF